MLFARAGANVVVSARRQDALDAVVAQCSAANKEGGSGAGGKYASLVLDMQDRKAIETDLLPRLPDWAKNVDVLLANAGLVLGTDKVGEISGDEIDTMIQTNVVGLIATVQLFVKGECVPAHRWQ